MAVGFPPIPVYPLAIDSDRTLYLVFNTSEAALATENQPWEEEVEIVPVGANEDEIWAENGFATITGELFYYDDVGKNSDGKIYKFKRCARNLGGDATQINKAGTMVRGFVVAEHHNQIVEAICMIEKFVGVEECPEPPDETLRSRICELELEAACLDDANCPDVILETDVLSTDSCEGTIIEYTVLINGTFTSLVVDFGDGNISTEQTGTHQYAPNSIIDPIVTVSSSGCQVVQTPIERLRSEEPEAAPLTEPFEIPIPELPEFPDIDIPDIDQPDTTLTLPQIVFPCLDIGPIGPIGPINIPSIIVVDPPIPSVILFGPIDIPSVISIDNIPTLTPITIDFPSFTPVQVDFGPTPSFAPIDVDFGPAPSFAPITVDFGAAPTITPISITSPTLTPISLDVPAISPITLDVPAISPITLDAPSLSPIGFGPAPSIGPIDFGPAPSIGPVDFGPAPTIGPIDFGPAPTIGPIAFGPAPSIGPITIDPVSVSVGPVEFGPAPTIGPIEFGPAPSIGPVEFGPAPTVNVDWGSPPTCSCTVTIACPSPSPMAAQARSDNFMNAFDPNFDEFEDGFDIDNIEVEVADIGIPSEIKIIPPELPDLRLVDDLPKEISLVAPEMPSEIKIIGPTETIPSEIKIVSDTVMPQTIRLDAAEVPEVIKLEVSDIPYSIKLEVPEHLPSVISLDASTVPSEIQVTGIPESIELKGTIPEEINLRVPDDLEIPMVYKGSPIPVQFDIKNLTGEGGEDLPCFAIVPCPKS